tara:strand:+ start:61451 stop:61915 length:465 start_codon:yes stop_codon:yes gene_type:complete
MEDKTFQRQNLVNQNAKNLSPREKRYKSSVEKKYFYNHNGKTFAGIHLLVDLWGAKPLDNESYLNETLVECLKAAKAKLLHKHIHKFEDNGGLTGIAVLAESHMSFHTWPETDYAAFDIFTCGNSTPDETIKVLKEKFNPDKILVKKIFRGEQN